jgi:hypothetical protein
MTQTIIPQAEPGPYIVTYDRDGVDEILSIVALPSDRILAQIAFWGNLEPGENAWRESTFRLLAAAPTLRDALMKLLAAIDYSKVSSELAVAIAGARYAVGTAFGSHFTNSESFLIPTVVEGV